MESRLQKDFVILWKHIAHQKGVIHRQKANIKDLHAHISDLEKTNRKLLVSFLVLFLLLVLL